MFNQSKSVISFFIPALNGGGAQRVVVNLANALPDITDHPIHVVLARKEGEFVDELRPEVKIVDLGTKRVSRSVFALARYMHRERPQAMISTLNYANVMFLISGLLAGKPCPLIVREANVVRKPSGSLGGKLRGHVTQGLMRVLYPRADRVVAISRDVQQSLLDAGIKIGDKLALIGNPVEMESPRNEPVDLSWLPHPSLRKKTSLPANIANGREKNGQRKSIYPACPACPMKCLPRLTFSCLTGARSAASADFIGVAQPSYAIGVKQSRRLSG